MRSTILSSTPNNASPLSPAPPNTPVLLVLLADSPTAPVLSAYGTYHDIFSSLFRRSLTLLASESGDGTERWLEVTSYDVVGGEYPTEAELGREQVRGVLITGSAASVHSDQPWISSLTSFTSSLPLLHPRLKIIGICFGHQIVARAFGGKVERNVQGGWEWGVRDIALTEVGRRVLGNNGRETIKIHQVHQDHVPFLPAGFSLLGSTSQCPVHGLLRISSPSPSSFNLSDIQIFTVQGHPEFSPDIVLKIIDVREGKGVISKEVAERGREDAREEGDGVFVGKRVLAILGV